MRKNILLALSTLLIFVLLAACGDTEGASDGEETIVLKAGSNLSTTHVMMENLIIPMLDKIEEDSDGRVKFEMFDSETLVRAGEELEALRSSTIDIAVPIYDVYDAARFPFSELPLLPVTVASPEVYNKAMILLSQDEEPYADGKTHYERLYGDQDLKAWPYAYGRSYTIATNTGPIEDAKDLEALQIRVPSTIHEIFTKKLGASPANISANEAYDAFNRGTLDAGFTPVIDWESYGLDEVLTYAIDGIEAGSWPSAIAMTSEKYESLPKDIQEIIDNAIRETTNFATNPGFKEVNDEIEVEMFKRFTDNGGVVEAVTDLPQVVQDRIDAAVGETWLQWIAELEKDGQPATEAAIKWRDAILEAGGDVPDMIKELSVN